MHRDEIPPGTLYLLILKTLSRSGELHGYEIANSIQPLSEDVLQVEEGSLYPALQRMLIKVGLPRNGAPPLETVAPAIINSQFRVGSAWPWSCRSSTASSQLSHI